MVSTPFIGSSGSDDYFDRDTFEKVKRGLEGKSKPGEYLDRDTFDKLKKAKESYEAHTGKKTSIKAVPAKPTPSARKAAKAAPAKPTPSARKAAPKKKK